MKIVSAGRLSVNDILGIARVGGLSVLIVARKGYWRDYVVQLCKENNIEYKVQKLCNCDEQVCSCSLEEKEIVLQELFDVVNRYDIVILHGRNGVLLNTGITMIDGIENRFLIIDEDVTMMLNTIIEYNSYLSSKVMRIQRIAYVLASIDSDNEGRITATHVLVAGILAGSGLNNWIKNHYKGLLDKKEVKNE